VQFRSAGGAGAVVNWQAFGSGGETSSTVPVAKILLTHYRYKKHSLFSTVRAVVSSLSWVNHNVL
jgi:hypothetical protein